MLMSESQEIALGKEADPSIVAEYGLYENPTLQAFITTKGKEMAAISHRKTLPYEFKILDSPVVNAFAVPGGYVYFTRGIMAHFNNEAEFAGVLGHEIGHITARHGASQYSKQILAQVALVGGMVASQDFARFADLANTGLGLLFLKFGRSDESESDEIGVVYSTDIGYNAHKMADFFKTLQKMSSESGGSIPTFLSTHPDPGDRFQKVNETATKFQKIKGQSEASLKTGRDSYLKMIDGIIYGEDPRQGFFENNVFYHPELLFYFGVPKDWQTLNTPSQVQMAPKDGKALMFLELEASKTLDAAATDFVSRNKIVVEDKANVNVNGFPALALYGTQTPDAAAGEQGQALKLMAYFIQYNNNIYKMVGLTANADFNSYFNAFQTTMKSFNKLTDASKINKLPQRIKIVTAKKNGTLQQIMADYKMGQDKMNELSLLNGMDLTATVEAGTLVKVLELRK
ncbi:MAG: M48 family metalloprotease [Saprospiraceae bacterium]|nr:M48 family metalloprotease [Saprospiraceae bacterium]